MVFFASMTEPRFETLDLSSPDIHAVAAARLLATECPDLSPVVIEWDTESPEQNVKKYIEQYSNPAGTTYALVQDRRAVIAASNVMHNFGNTTSILNLAVHPDVRRSGHGTRLIRNIAEQAIALGDVKLGYNANHDYFIREDEKGFLHSLRFREVMEVTFEIEATELLARTATPS